MGKKEITPIVPSWMKFVWNFAWCPSSSFGMKESRKPVAFGLLLLLGIYFIPELYLFLIVDNAAPGVHLPITTNTTASPCYFAPYCLISAKGLFQGPTDFYIQKPLAIMSNHVFHIDSFLSANFISLLHIITALISAKLIASDSLIVRRVGVLVYLLRNFLDCLDGVVAKEELKRQGNLHVLNQPTGAWGYFIDGISDGLGCIFLLAACLLHLQRHPYQRKIQQKIYSPLSVVSMSKNGKSCCSSIQNKKGKRCSEADRDVEARLNAQKETEFFSSWCVAFRECLSMCGITGTGFPAFLFLNQLFLSSLCWNRNILLYGRLLEPTSSEAWTNGNRKDLERVASNLIHSPIMWLVIFGWRIFNPMFMSEILLLFIFMDKMHECLQLFQYSGFVIITCVAAISEVHRLTDPSIYQGSKNYG